MAQDQPEEAQELEEASGEVGVVAGWVAADSELVESVCARIVATEQLTKEARPVMR
jgi:hypothetical protein